jgi:NADPH:quinone reductase-like Zn-dependent oxidoreductase
MEGCAFSQSTAVAKYSSGTFCSRDGVGEVVEVGPDVTRVRLGVRVAPTFSGAVREASTSVSALEYILSVK